MKRFAEIFILLIVSSCLFAQEVTLIPLEAVIKGTLRCRRVRVDGIFEGKLIVEDRIEVSEDGNVKGSINTVSGVINGRVEGDIYASKDLLLTSTAMVGGEITCRKLVVEEGALIEAKTSMGELKEIEKKKKVVPKKKATTGRRRRRRRSY